MSRVHNIHKRVVKTHGMPFIVPIEKRHFHRRPNFSLTSEARMTKPYGYRAHRLPRMARSKHETRKWLMAPERHRRMIETGQFPYVKATSKIKPTAYDPYINQSHVSAYYDPGSFGNDINNYIRFYNYENPVSASVRNVGPAYFPPEIAGKEDFINFNYRGVPHAAKINNPQGTLESVRASQIAEPNSTLQNYLLMREPIPSFQPRISNSHIGYSLAGLENLGVTSAIDPSLSTRRSYLDIVYTPPNANEILLSRM